MNPPVNAASLSPIDRSSPGDFSKSLFSLSSLNSAFDIPSNTPMITPRGFATFRIAFPNGFKSVISARNLSVGPNAALIP